MSLNIPYVPPVLDIDMRRSTANDGLSKSSIHIDHCSFVHMILCIVV